MKLSAPVVIASLVLALMLGLAIGARSTAPATAAPPVPESMIDGLLCRSVLVEDFETTPDGVTALDRGWKLDPLPQLPESGNVGWHLLSPFGSAEISTVDLFGPNDTKLCADNVGGLANDLQPDLVLPAGATPGTGLSDGSTSERLPAAFSGDEAVWFGNPFRVSSADFTPPITPTITDTVGSYADDSANFFGDPQPCDSNSGYTSKGGPYEGSLTSPPLNAGPGSILTFRTWWEIESVRPSTHDLMEVLVSKNGGPWIPVKTLNPTSDPPAGAPNRPMTQWVEVAVDLTPIVGQALDDLRVRFYFNTVDNLYNGWRGWLIDDVAIRQALVFGEVRDCQGNPLAGATVTIDGTSLSAVTNSAGFYAIYPILSGQPVIVQPGTYTLRASKAGFTPVVQAFVVGEVCGIEVNFTGPFCLPLQQIWPPFAAYLPVLNVVDTQAGYSTRVEVQNMGNEDAIATLTLYGASLDDCISSPLETETSGLIRPGTAWVFDNKVISTAARAGIVRSSLPSGTGNPPPLAVEVLRTGIAIPTGTLRVSSTYNGVTRELLGVEDTFFGGFTYYTPLLYGSRRGLTSWIYIQNAGDRCTLVDVSFHQQGDCLRTQIMRIDNLAPGEHYALDVASTVGTDWIGSATISAGQPLALAVDNVGNDLLMTYTGLPSTLDYTFEDPGDADSSAGSQVNYAPLVFREDQGWDTVIQVQNLSSVAKAKVKAYFLDASGNVIVTLVDWICPRGSESFNLAPISSFKANYVGAARVESQDWWTPGDPPVPFPHISSVAQLIKYEGPARLVVLEGITYNLLPEFNAYDWQTGEREKFSRALLAIPSILRKSRELTSEIAIQNAVPVPGFTDVAIYFYDANRLVDYVCQKIQNGEVDYIDLNTWSFISPGFAGSAVISATYWEHDIQDPITGEPRNVVGLAAVRVERMGTVLGTDFPGDESTGSEGQPIPVQFRFRGPPDSGPQCPGQP